MAKTRWSHWAQLILARMEAVGGIAGCSGGGRCLVPVTGHDLGSEGRVGGEHTMARAALWKLMEWAKALEPLQQDDLSIRIRHEYAKEGTL